MFVDPNVCNSMLTSDLEAMIMKVSISKYNFYIWHIQYIITLMTSQYIDFVQYCYGLLHICLDCTFPSQETGTNHTIEGCYFIWAVIQCSLLEIHYFGGTYHLHIQGRRVNQAISRKQSVEQSTLLAACWLCLLWQLHTRQLQLLLWTNPNLPTAPI
jgi:hypothetical protein